MTVGDSTRGEAALVTGAAPGQRRAHSRQGSFRRLPCIMVQIRDGIDCVVANTDTAECLQ